jgi:NAD(P)-dependent dehydrogenase (short-subunit alcohol dehydrogenase family)
MDFSKEYQAKKEALKGKVILISGGGSGIGKAAAVSFGKHGADLVLIGKSIENLESTYEDFIKMNLKPPLLHSMDFENASEKDYQEVNEVIMGEFGRLDGLLNNASILGDRTPLEHYKLDVWKKVFEVNVHASFLLTKSLMPSLKLSKNASVIFTSSVVGKIGKAYWGAYSLSKFSTESMMQIFSEELKNTSNIRVNSINPGRVRTKMRAAAYPAEDPLSVLDAKNIMSAYLFLMSDDSKETSGASIAAQ